MTTPINTPSESTTAPEIAAPHLVAPAPDVEAPRSGRAKRRFFTAEFKRRIVAEYDAAPAGSKGAVLRRERLYDSHIKEWRAAIAAGTIDAAKKPGRPARSPQQARIAELERRLDKAQAESARTDKVIADRDAALEVLGKGVEFLEAISQQGRTR